MSPKAHPESSSDLELLKTLMREQAGVIEKSAQTDARGLAVAWMAKGDSLVFFVARAKPQPSSRMYTCKILETE